MKAPTAKQASFAAKLFNDIATRSARLGCPISTPDYRADMARIDLNPDSGLDVSRYIAMHFRAKQEAQIMMRGRAA